MAGCGTQDAGRCQDHPRSGTDGAAELLQRIREVVGAIPPPCSGLKGTQPPRHLAHECVSLCVCVLPFLTLTSVGLLCAPPGVVSHGKYQEHLIFRGISKNVQILNETLHLSPLTCELPPHSNKLQFRTF